jgi:hypothetical protein
MAQGNVPLSTQTDSEPIRKVNLAGDQERFGQTIAETVSARGETLGAALLLRKLSKVLIASRKSSFVRTGGNPFPSFVL